jgi:hypothetical protein
VSFYQQAVSHHRLATERAPQLIEFRNERADTCAALADVLLRLGRPYEAATYAVDIRNLCPRDSDKLFSAARLLALSANSVESTTGVEERSDTELPSLLTYQDAASETLRLAVAAGFRDLNRLSNDSAFAALRGRPDYQALLIDLDFPADPFQRYR